MNPQQFYATMGNTRMTNYILLAIVVLLILIFVFRGRK